MTEEAKETKLTAEQLQAKALQSLTDAVRPMLTVMLRGAVDTMRNIPPEFMMIAYCRALAAVIGDNYGGEDDGIRKFREKCRVEFSASLHQAPVRPLMTAPPKEPESAAEEAA